MKRLVIIVFFAFAGFIIAAVSGYGAVMVLSANSHDRLTEAVMTAAFVVGPVGAVLGSLIGIVRIKNKSEKRG